jgi:hypothetical protein
MRSQIVTASPGAPATDPPKRNIRYLPYAFTEHGALMAANILNSPRAVAMSAKQNVCSNHGANPSQHFRVCVFACCLLLSQFQLFPCGPVVSGPFSPSPPAATLPSKPSSRSESGHRTNALNKCFASACPAH